MVKGGLCRKPTSGGPAGYPNSGGVPGFGMAADSLSHFSDGILCRYPEPKYCTHVARTPDNTMPWPGWNWQRSESAKKTANPEDWRLDLPIPPAYASASSEVVAKHPGPGGSLAPVLYTPPGASPSLVNSVGEGAPTGRTGFHQEVGVLHAVAVFTSDVQRRAKPTGTVCTRWVKGPSKDHRCSGSSQQPWPC